MSSDNYTEQLEKTTSELLALLQQIHLQISNLIKNSNNITTTHSFLSNPNRREVLNSITNSQSSSELMTNQLSRVEVFKNIEQDLQQAIERLHSINQQFPENSYDKAVIETASIAMSA